LQYSRGSLLSIDQFSPTQFDKVDVILSSNEAGVFNIEIMFTPPGHTKTSVNKASVTMHDVRFRSPRPVLLLITDSLALE
jgi:Ras GTPase-activating-like protein IQGAP2/3